MQLISPCMKQDFRCYRVKWDGMSNVCAVACRSAEQFTGRPFSGREMQYVCSRREHKFMIYGDKGTYACLRAGVLRPRENVRASVCGFTGQRTFMICETPVHGL